MRGEQAGVAILDAHGLSAHERAGLGAQYEQWLAAGFAQAAYMARDIAAYGCVMPETKTRVNNERKGLAIEKLGKPFTTTFNYELSPMGLVAEDGERFVSIFARGRDQAAADAAQDRRLMFRLDRHNADVAHAEYLEAIARDPRVPEGTTVIINSPSPDHRELGVPRELLENFHYRPGVGMAMQWIAVKTATGIKLQTNNLFHAEPHQLAEATSAVSGRPVDLCDRESMPWQRTTFLGEPGKDIAEELRLAFDTACLRDTGEVTFHGLPRSEQAEQNATHLVETDEFEHELLISDQLLEQVARSLVSGELHVDKCLVEKILEMKDSHGRSELSGERRAVVERILANQNPQEGDLETTLWVVQQTIDAMLWATLRSLADGERIEIVTDSRAASYDGISRVETHRQSGAVEFGCPGDGRAAEQKGLFDVSADQLASAFMRKTFITNCPMCDEKGVMATQESGAITCHECGACVDICTGEVLQKARKKERATKAAGRAATKTISSPIDWLFDQFAEHKRKRVMRERTQRQRADVA